MKLFPEAPYDVDVAIIGGGPAGMSAAVRCRWVKSYRSLPCSVAVFEPGTLGGLAGWRTCSITGPGYRYLGDGLIQRIATDFERYRIPVVPERVVSLHRDKGLFILETDTGTRVRALSVIVATGMRALAGERTSSVAACSSPTWATSTSPSSSIAWPRLDMTASWSSGTGRARTSPRWPRGLRCRYPV